MAHMFEIMSTITGQINILSEYYDSPGKSSIRRLPTVPEFILSATDRYIMRHNEIIDDINKPVNAKLCILSDNGDAFNPVYISVISNITKPIIDRISFQANHKDQSGPGICIYLGIPKFAFDPDADILSLAQLLKDIYFGILALDPILEYKPSIKIVRLACDPRIDIKSYDIQMTYVALCCMNIVMKKWFGENTKDIEEYTLTPFNEIDLPKTDRNTVIKILNEFAKNIASVRESIEKGTLLKSIVDG